LLVLVGYGYVCDCDCCCCMLLVSGLYCYNSVAVYLRGLSFVCLCLLLGFVFALGEFSLVGVMFGYCLLVCLRLFLLFVSVG